MTLAILIGFSYLHSSSRPLPGTLIDLYRVWRWCKILKYDVIILSDLELSSFPEDISSIIAQDHVDIEIMTFREKTSHHYVSNLSETQHLLQKYCRQAQDHLLLYYSGHGTKRGWKTPCGSILKWDALGSLVMSSCFPSVDLCWIMDCCYASAFSLPYRLEWKGEQDLAFFEKNYSTEHTISFSHSPTILLFNAGQATEKSKSSRYGSLFTRHFTSVLEEMSTPNSKIKTWKLGDICQHVQSRIVMRKEISQQTISVYCSHPLIPLLWWWLRGFFNISYDVSLGVVHFFPSSDTS